jgi:arginyl-tRNA synthetase
VVENVAYESANLASVKLHSIEIELVKFLQSYPQRITEAANSYSPAVIADFVYELARLYGKFFSELSVFNEPDLATKSMRLALSSATARAIKSAMSLIGVEVPERM